MKSLRACHVDEHIHGDCPCHNVHHHQRDSVWPVRAREWGGGEGDIWQEGQQQNDEGDDLVGADRVLRKPRDKREDQHGACTQYNSKYDWIDPTQGRRSRIGSQDRDCDHPHD